MFAENKKRICFAFGDTFFVCLFLSFVVPHLYVEDACSSPTLVVVRLFHISGEADKRFFMFLLRQENLRADAATFLLSHFIVICARGRRSRNKNGTIEKCRTHKYCDHRASVERRLTGMETHLNDAISDSSENKVKNICFAAAQ